MALHLDKLSPKSAIFARVFVIVAIILIIFAVVRIHQALEPKVYTNKASGFSVIFPGNPTVRSQSLPLSIAQSGNKQQGTVYAGSTPNGGYLVYVIHNSSLNASTLSQSSLKNTLETEVAQIAQVEKATVNNARVTTFNGQTAAEATLSTSNVKIGQLDMLALMHQSNIYLLIGAGVTNTNYTKFIASFHNL